ncbi:hypothetical protein GCM10007901_06500 [Dyella acidisoli]|uniref:Uncharacterized protein n=1 Tax=Dyella acidisoli TaxID=1867834 RepID=A0ABQ5XJ44_9GAMM|nr:hypothetical protein GCM10007901_06500 [Dyella acidisoli]
MLGRKFDTPPTLPDIATTLPPCKITGLAVPLAKVTRLGPNPWFVLALLSRLDAWPVEFPNQL